ncbi:ABC transporter permease [Acuticoccus kandeliae]|uniref:ABC transporter permease n=1 Tax=Acuticoccus kandeliae TaxID=2073160 RepID=UPI000D3E62E6|nr:ABC transporter permease [Acuticoccus kandeliae]
MAEKSLAAAGAPLGMARARPWWSRLAWPGRVGLLLLPAVAFMVVFYIHPVLMMLETSVQPPEGAAGITAQHYAEVFDSRRMMASLERTIRLSALSTLITFLIAYPIALFLIGARPWLRTSILVFTFASLAASIIVRNYGWLVVLADGGPVNSVLVALGIVEWPVRLVYSEGAVLVALVHYAMPFMILPIYGALVRLQPSVWEAAQSLGASPWTVLRSVVLPLSMPGVFGGVTLSFAIAASAYVTPLMLGSPATAFASQVAADELLVQLNFPRGSAVIVLLTLCTFAVIGLYALAVRRIGKTHVRG